MKVFVLTYPCAEGRADCKCRRNWETEVHETREAAYKAAEGRMFSQVMECEVGASWQTRAQRWTEPEPLEIEKTLEEECRRSEVYEREFKKEAYRLNQLLEGERRRCDIFESEVYRINGMLAEEKAKVAALEEQLNNS
jgi:hypothetical protein